MDIDWILLKRSIYSVLSKEEQERLNEWLEEDSAHREFYREVQVFLADSESFRLDKRKIQYFKSIYEARLAMVERKRHRIRSRRIWKMVAAFLLPLGIAWFWWWHAESISDDTYLPDNKFSESIFPGTQKAILVTADGRTVPLDAITTDVEVFDGVKVKNRDHSLIYSDSLIDVSIGGENQMIVPRGGEYAIVLSDGTKVWLNSTSELRYPIHFSETKRQVYLKGEAYFQVASDCERAFIVQTDDVEIKVYGTEFNINTRVADYVQTTLVKGSISVKSGDGEERILRPNQLAQFDRATGETVVKDVDVSNYIGWKSGIYVFENKSIEQIMEELSLWYDVEIFFRNNVSRFYRFSGSLPRYQEIADMLNLIEQTTHVRFEVKGKTVIVD